MDAARSATDAGVPSYCEANTLATLVSAQTWKPPSALFRAVMYTSCAMSWSIMYASAMTAVKHSCEATYVRGTRRGREDIVVVDEWVPLGLASQGLDQANQCIAEGAEALDDRRDELAAYRLRKGLYLFCL